MAQPATAAFKVIQVCSVAPLPQPTHPSTIVVPTSLPLTFFDLLWLRFPPVQRLFFYEFLNLTSTSFFGTVLPSLRHSLSLTLQHFLPFSGTLTWLPHSSKPIINYTAGNAIYFTVAESNADFNTLSSNCCKAAERHCLTPHFTTSHDQASLLALQVTVFPNYGFCVGITTHHAAFDGKSSTMFMKSWAYICSNLQKPAPTPSLLLPQHLTPFFDRSVIRDPSGFAEAYAETWIKSGEPNNRSLKVWESLNTIPSDAVKAEQPKEDDVVFIFAVDCRSRLDPPIPATYFGNCVVGQWVVAAMNNLAGNDGFISALEGIVEALNRVKDDGVLSGAESWVLDMNERRMKGRIFCVAGSPLFEVYSSDFGWGRPKKVDMISIDRTRAFSLSESRDHSGGIEIGLVLSKREMDAFTTLFAQELESF